MKKLLSIIIVLVMMLSLLPVQQMAFAEDSEAYTVKFFNTFEEGNTSEGNISSYNSGEYELDSQTYADMAGNGTVLKMVSDGQKRGIDISFDEVISISEDVYVEVELDLAFKKVSSDNQMKLCINTTSYMMFMMNNSFKTEDPNATVSRINSEKLSRYKITLKPERSGESRVWSIVGFTVDGNEMIAEGVSYPSNSAKTDILKLRMRFGSNNKDDAVYLDNISVTTYYSKDGTSPVPQKYPLLNKIREASELANASLANDEISESDFDKINARISTAISVLQNKASTQEEFNEQLKSLDKVEDLIDAYKTIKETGALYAIEGVKVTGDDGTEYSDLVPCAMLKEITLYKYSPEAFCGNLYIVFYDENQKLSNVYSKEVSFDEETGNKVIDLSDKNIALPENIRSYSAFAMLWDNEQAPVMSKYIWENLSKWDVYYNSQQIRPDSMPVYRSNGEIYVGIKYLLNLIGVTLFEDNGHYSAVRDYDSAYIDFYIGSDTVASSNGEYVLSSPSYLADDCAVMLPVNILCEVFGCELYEVDGINGRIYITYTESDYAYSELDWYFSTSYSAEVFGASYSITVPSGWELLEVWYKPTISVPDSSFNNEDINTAMDTRYWQKAITPVKNRNTYTGSMSYLKTSTSYDIKYVVTTNKQDKIFVDKSAFKTGSYADSKSEVIYDASSLTLTPTYENIGYYIDYDGAACCEVAYKKSNENEWHKAYEPFNDTIENQFRGSIVKLEDNTEYEVKVILKDEQGNVINEQLAKAVTWNNNPDCTTVNLADYIGDFEVNNKTITEPIQLVGIEGSADNWIKIDCSGYTVDAGNNSTAAVNVDNCKYVIIDSLTVKGGYRCGIALNDSCSNVRISGCDISGFGRTGVQDENGWFYRDSTPINYDAGILLLDGKNITIEDCYIHDARAKTNPWQGSTWENTHPYGSTGIYYCIKEGCVIRNNRIIGNETHRWNDGIEGRSNSAYKGAASRDTDIYGNIIAYGQDDGIELDGSQMNVRVYKNTVNQFLCGFSLVPNLLGPSYLYENIIYDMGTECHIYGKALKVGGSQNKSMSYVFNNTFFVNGVVAENTKYADYEEYNLVTRNNIFINTRGGTCYKNTVEGTLNNNDYDFCYGNYINYSNGGHSKQYTASSNTEYTKINYGTLLGRLGFNDAENGDFSISESSECFGAGVYIDNFCEQANPNIGAVQ